MQTSFFDWKSKGRMAILVLLTATVVFILWSLFQLVKQTEIDERQRMEVWALAQKQFVKDIDLNDDVDPLIFEVLTSENSIPMIVVDEYDNIVSFNNIDPQRALLKDSLLLKNTLKDLKKQNDPIEIVFENAGKIGGHVFNLIENNCVFGILSQEQGQSHVFSPQC